MFLDVEQPILSTIALIFMAPGILVVSAMLILSVLSLIGKIATAILKVILKDSED
jgi:hypothetical protein